MVYLASALAYALTAREPCVGPEFTGALPAPGAVDVPVDARLLLFGEVGTCSDLVSWTASLTLGDEGAGAWTIETLEQGRAILSRSEDLVADTAYVLSVDPAEGAGEPLAFGFTTGSRRSTGASGTPALNELDTHLLDKEAGTHWFGGLAVPAEDPDGLSSVGLALAGGSPQGWVPYDPEGVWVTFEGAERGNTEVCLEVVQEDNLGNQLRSAPRCATTERVGCATAGGGGWAALLLGALALRRVR